MRRSLDPLSDLSNGGNSSRRKRRVVQLESAMRAALWALVAHAGPRLLAPAPFTGTLGWGSCLRQDREYRPSRAGLPRAAQRNGLELLDLSSSCRRSLAAMEPTNLQNGSPDDRQKKTRRFEFFYSVFLCLHKEINASRFSGPEQFRTFFRRRAVDFSFVLNDARFFDVESAEKPGFFTHPRS